MIFGHIFVFMGCVAWMDFMTGAWLSVPRERRSKEAA